MGKKKHKSFQVGIQQLVSLLTCFLLLLAVAINKEQKVFGIPLASSKIQKGDKVTTAADDTIRTTADGTVIISTTQIAKDIVGYAGNVPLDIYMKAGRIVKVVPLRNAESPSFFSRVKQSGLLSAWNNLSPDEAAAKQVDGVSGATFSSRAVIKSVQRAMSYAKHSSHLVKETDTWKPDLKFVCVLLVVLSGLILPYFFKSKKMRTVQLVLNVIVLGFWSGSFISLSLLTNFLSQGVNLWLSIIPLLLLVGAFVLPLFGKKEHYCMWLCPMGSLQELVGKSVPYKISLQAKTVKYLGYFREGLWAVIMLVMWCGVGFQLMDYEVFSAFLFQSAATPVLVLGLVFLLLSCVIQRPYCRFVCPTGTLFKVAQSNK